MSPESPQEDGPRIVIEVYDQAMETSCNGVVFGKTSDGIVQIVRVMNALRHMGVREYTVRDQRELERRTP